MVHRSHRKCSMKFTLSWLPVFFWSSGFECPGAPENGRTEEPGSSVLSFFGRTGRTAFFRSPVHPFFGRTGRTAFFRSPVHPFFGRTGRTAFFRSPVHPFFGRTGRTAFFRSSVLPFARSSGEPEEPRSSVLPFPRATRGESPLEQKTLVISTESTSWVNYLLPTNIGELTESHRFCWPKNRWTLTWNWPEIWGWAPSWPLLALKVAGGADFLLVLRLVQVGGLLP